MYKGLLGEVISYNIFLFLKRIKALTNGAGPDTGFIQARLCKIQGLKKGIPTVFKD